MADLPEKLQNMLLEDKSVTNSPLGKEFPQRFEKEGIIRNKKYLVFFDLETTGLEKECDIVQIACQFGSDTLNHYILPTKAIHPLASKVNGITVNDGNLFIHGTEVQHINVKKAMDDFKTFLQSIGGTVILAAHNGHRFDAPILLRIMKSVDVVLPDNVEGFMDTWKLAKRLYPGRASYKQTDLVTDILESRYAAHNAAADVEVLQELVARMLEDKDPKWDILEEFVLHI